MGNPGPQPRSNGSKSNQKPKHRHSGSVSNISFTSEDSKPKHRHSGSVSNISLTPEDLKPKHRHNGSVSNISFTSEDLKPKHRPSGSVSNIIFNPEDPKPKHRHSGSVSNIFITPEEQKPKHRHSGSVSSITINSDDFSSPVRGSFNSSSSVSSVSSSVSLKEKRLKRRTRSSLGGTEDFIKELDFLTPSPNGRTPDSSTRKELLKPSPSPPFSESDATQAASEALASVPETAISPHAERFVENFSVERSNDPAVEKADAGENGGSFHDEKFVSSVDETVQPGDAVHLVESKHNGVDRGSTGTVETDDDGSVLNEVEEHGSQAKIAPALENGRLLVGAAPIPVVETTASDSTDLASVEKEPDEFTKAYVGGGSSLESLASDTAGANVSQNSEEQQEFANSNDRGPQVTGGTVTSPTNGESQPEPSKEELSRDEQGAKDTQEEKVSVQKRIEELEKIAGGRPVHFRSQSLSLPRPFDISHAKHHEAEGSKGFKMPAYRAPLDWASVSEVGSSDVVGTCQHEDLTEESLPSDGMASTKGGSSSAAGAFHEIEESLPSEGMASTRGVSSSAAGAFHEIEESLPSEGMASTRGGSSSAAGAFHEISADETQPPNILQNEESSESPAVGPPLDEISEQPQPHFEPFLSEAPKEAELPDTLENGININGKTSESLEGLPADKAEINKESEISNDVSAHAMERKASEIGKEDGDAPVLVPGDSVRHELPVAHSEARANQTRENGGKVENGDKVEPAKAEAMVEPPPQALQTTPVVEVHQTGTWPEAANIGGLPVAQQAHQGGTLPDVPSVAQNSMAEQAGHDDETAMLLTKQPAVDPLFVDSQQDRLWEMHSQELSIEESSGNEVRESSAQDCDSRPYANGTSSQSEVAPACSASSSNGNAQSHKSGKVDRPRTPLRSLLAEEDAEKCPDSGPLGTSPQTQSVSPKTNLFKRIVSGGKNSPTKQTTPTKFSPKNQPAAKPFLSSCMCCSVK